jgi:hypothetical protein
MQDSLQQAREETAAALRQQEQVGLVVAYGLLLGSSVFAGLFCVVSICCTIVLVGEVQDSLQPAAGPRGDPSSSTVPAGAGRVSIARLSSGVCSSFRVCCLFSLRAVG